MIHVYMIPPQRAEDYCFDGGHGILFHCVDWFNEPDGLPSVLGTVTDDDLIADVKKKRYYNPAVSYLLLMRERALVIPATVP